MAHFITPTTTLRTALILATAIMLVSMTACSKPAIVNGKAVVDLDGTSYTLDIVADNPTRERGLGGASELPDNGGMLFVFPDSRLRTFVMRDCLIDIDIIFLDPTGRIVAMHHMPKEELKADSESPVQYEQRLKRYPSRFSAKFAIEIAGGKLETLDLKDGQLIKLDVDYLKSIVQ